MFKEGPASTNNVLHEVEGLMGFWFPRVAEGDRGRKKD